MKTKTPIKALIYSRSATKLQSAKIEQQEDNCRAHAANHHFNVTAIYCDDGISGMTKERPSLNKLLDFLKSNAESEQPEQYVVLVDSVKCLSRNIKDYLELKDTIKALGCELHAVERSLQDTSESDFVETTLLATQEMEDKLAEESL